MLAIDMADHRKARALSQVVDRQTMQRAMFGVESERGSVELVMGTP
jgi:hypothetical protein